MQQAAEIGLAVALHALLDAVEHRAVDADRIVLGLQQIVGGRADEAGLRDVAPVVPREIAHDLAAAHRVADERRVAHTGLRDHRGEIVGEGIEVVAGCRLRRAAEAAAIVGDHAIAGLRERGRLIVPDVGIERPGVGHDDGAAGAAGVLDENLGAILGLDLGGACVLSKGNARQRGGGRCDECSCRGYRGGSVMRGLLCCRGARYGGLTRRQSQAAGPENSSRVLETKQNGPRCGPLCKPLPVSPGASEARRASRNERHIAADADVRQDDYLIATGLIMLCTAPLKRGWPSTNMNS